MAVKVCSVFCNCGGTLDNIDWDELKHFMEENQSKTDDDFIFYSENLCSRPAQAELYDILKREKPRMLAFGGCSPKTAGMLFRDTLRDLGYTPYHSIGANFREHIAWVEKDKEKATERAKAAIMSAYSRAKALTKDVPRHRFLLNNNVVVIGAGPAGLQAAQDLALDGYKVHLIERNSYLGGKTVELGYFFPSDDCAACLPAEGVKGIHQSNVRRCLYRSGFELEPNIRLYMQGEVNDVDGVVGNYKVQVHQKPQYVEMNRCVNCGKCSTVCPIEVPDEMNLGLIKRKAIYLPSVTAMSTKYVLDRDSCEVGCTKCADVCPTKAIDLDAPWLTHRINAGGFIVATGFDEYDPHNVPEYGYGQPGFENVFTQKELARLMDITGPTQGKLTKRANGDPVNSVVIINCVGSRSEKYNEWCSNICCMIGLKNAIKIKESAPDTEVTMCYIDIRAVGPGYEEYYKKARAMGIKFLRGRPSNVESDGESLYVITEDSIQGKPQRLKTDVVALSMAMVPSKGVTELADNLNINISEHNFFEALYSKLRSTESKQPGVFFGGAALSPADIPTSVMRSAHAASKLDLILRDKAATKRYPRAQINQEKCVACELCASACPFEAITVVDPNTPRTIVEVNPTSCMGCGTCISSCPNDAIELPYYEEQQLIAGIEGMLHDGKTSTDPIIIAISCWECSYSSIDYIGQLALTRPEMRYPPNIRIINAQCTGSISTRTMEKAFELGADGVLIVGCYEDRCHYDTGSQTSKQRVNILKRMMEQKGLDPRRLEKVHIYCSTSTNFVEASKEMVSVLNEIGRLPRD